jgi:hypothetical protein
MVEIDPTQLAVDVEIGGDDRLRRHTAGLREL